MPEKLFLPVPVQNTESFDKISTYTPLFFAYILDFITNNVERNIECILPLNNIGLKIDRVSQDSGLERKEFCQRNEQNRINFLKSCGRENIRVFRDDDLDYFEFLSRKIQNFIELGLITKKDCQVWVCNKCGHEIENIGIVPSKCNNCSYNDFKTINSEALFLKLPEDKTSLIRDKLFGYDSKRKNSIISLFRQLPNEIIISRKRSYGLNLADFDLDEKVLDPKLSMALLPEFIANRLGYDQLVQITGARHVTKGVHFSSLFSSIQDQYLLLCYYNLDDFIDNSQTAQGYAQFYQAGKDQDLSSNHTKQIITEYLKLSKSASIILNYLQEFCADDNLDNNLELSAGEIIKIFYVILKN